MFKLSIVSFLFLFSKLSFGASCISEKTVTGYMSKSSEVTDVFTMTDLKEVKCDLFCEFKGTVVEVFKGTLQPGQESTIAVFYSEAVRVVSSGTNLFQTKIAELEDNNKVNLQIGCAGFGAEEHTYLGISEDLEVLRKNY